jgi:hypothetical protein
VAVGLLRSFSTLPSGLSDSHFSTFFSSSQ